MAVLLGYNVQHRVELLTRKLSGRPPELSWSQIALATVPTPWRPHFRPWILPTTSSSAVDLRTFPLDTEGPFELYPVFGGPAGALEDMDGHYSVLRAGQRPHRPHVHEEEEVIVPIVGRVKIIRTDDPESDEERVTEIGPGALTYHASRMPHTIEAAGPGASGYMVFKWSGRSVAERPAALESMDLEFASAFDEVDEEGRFQTRVLLEGPTAHLSKLHVHVSTMTPGGGYQAHHDAHDVAVVMLAGEVETLGRKVGADSVVFYPADDSHGMRNTGDETARYLVIEFHGAAGL